MYYQMSLVRHGISVEINKYIVNHELYHIVPCIFCLLTTFDFSSKLGLTGITIQLLRSILDRPFHATLSLLSSCLSLYYRYKFPYLGS